MKKFSFIIIFLIAILCCSISCEKKNLQKKSNTTSLTDSVTHNPLCDSIYQGEFIVYVDENDTIINGTRYFYALQLKKNYMLVCAEYNKKYNVFVNAQIMHKDTLYAKIEEDVFFYSNISPSPNRQYIFFVKEYESGTTEPNGTEVTNFFIRFHSASIYDVVNKRTVYDDYMGRGFGDWTYCDQYVSDGEIIFDPADDLE